MAISRRAPFSDAVTLAAADDLNGDPTNAATYLDLTGKAGAIIAQIANGTAGTTGIDVIEISRDGGENWSLASVLTSANAAVTGSKLNAAGVEPTGAALFFIRGSDEDLTGPVLVRCVRDATKSATSAAWTTGAPQVVGIAIGG